MFKWSSSSDNSTENENTEISSEHECRICCVSFPSNKFRYHLQSEHSLNTRKYEETFGHINDFQYRYSETYKTYLRDLISFLTFDQTHLTKSDVFQATDEIKILIWRLNIAFLYQSFMAFIVILWLEKKFLHSKWGHFENICRD